MSEQKLTYEQWRERWSVTISENAKIELLKQGMDAEAELETAMRREYNSYIAGERDYG